MVLRVLLRAVELGHIDKAMIDVGDVQQTSLHAHIIPDPTAHSHFGRNALVQFLLWQISYTEMYVTPNCGRISQENLFAAVENLDAGNVATEWSSNLQLLRCTKGDLEVTSTDAARRPQATAIEKLLSPNLRATCPLASTRSNRRLTKQTETTDSSIVCCRSFSKADGFLRVFRNESAILSSVSSR